VLEEVNAVERIRENMDVFWSLDADELAALDGLEAAVGSHRTCWDPNTVKV
jgi:diketogulonate reductase-like aldo/keto reductase